MKKYIIHTGIFILATSFFASCSDLQFGDKFLGTAPESSGANLDTMFVTSSNADKVLTEAYRHTPYGIFTGGAGRNKLGANLLEAITDLYQSSRDNISDGPMNLYYNGALSASVSPNHRNSEAYRFAEEEEYNAIRYAWFYIENAERIPDISESLRNQRVAEAKGIIAMAYAEMLRYVGGVPILDHSVDPGEDMTYPRATFEETVDYIVKLIDEAAPYLPWVHSELDAGRMSQAGLLGLKVRVLLFAASPTFNSSTPWHPEADERTRYGQYSADRWNRVLDACRDFMGKLQANGGYSLEKASDDTPQARQDAFRKAYLDRASTECLISTRMGTNAEAVHASFLTSRLYSGPTLNYVNMFPWADGSDFPADFNWSSPEKAPFFDADGTPTRDPRLYETVVVPGDNYFNDTKGPVYTNNPFYWASGTGFLLMKFIGRNSTARTQYLAHWCYLRLPEIMLSYAEAINQVTGAPDETAYKMVNDVRTRVGLNPLPKNLSKDEFLEAVLRERALELGFEEVRWFDLVRYGRVNDFRKTLYGLISRGNDTNHPTEFTYQVKELPPRAWANKWDTKWYLSPIPLTEVNKNYGMTQNPGWGASGVVEESTKE
ncbi:MAG: RagB/SusD family nutrient uptake outer membrane protein [Porphyromonas sp.]|nr:RagB/SusD family nutrient uptake outer membrane protein [Bacteroidales bacterium]MDY3100695.1 RagB/SusD family nutrient uptake outer membrane protein [Porphyromonas sp.]